MALPYKPLVVGTIAGRHPGGRRISAHSPHRAAQTGVRTILDRIETPPPHTACDNAQAARAARAEKAKRVGVSMPQELCDIGLIGLAVMGQNLVLNMNDHGFRVAVFNRTVSKVDDFLNDEAKGTHDCWRALDRGADRAAEAAAPRDADGQGRRDGGPHIEQLVPHLEPGDIIIDGGNSHFPDTTRRTQDARRKGHPVHRHGRFGRRGGRAPRPVDHARRQPAGMAVREGRSSRRSRPRWTARRAATGWARMAPATT